MQQEINIFIIFPIQAVIMILYMINKCLETSNCMQNEQSEGKIAI